MISAGDSCSGRCRCGQHKSRMNEDALTACGCGGFGQIGRHRGWVWGFGWVVQCPITAWKRKCAIRMSVDKVAGCWMGGIVSANCVVRVVGVVRCYL